MALLPMVFYLAWALAYYVLVGASRRCVTTRLLLLFQGGEKGLDRPSPSV